MPPKINKELLPLKIHYFFKYGGIAFLTFLPVVILQKGIPELHLGLLYTITPFASCVLNLLLSTIADAYKIHRLIFLAGEITLSVSFILIFLLPDVSTSSSTQMKADIHLHCQDEAIRTYGLCLEDSNGGDVSPLFQECNDTFGRANNAGCVLSCSFLSNVTGFDSPSNFSHSFEESPYCSRSCIFIDVANGTESQRLICGSTYEALCSYDCSSLTSFVSVIEIPEFWLVLLLLLMISAGNSATTTMADTVCFYMLGEEPHKYGLQRMWGSMGWGLFGVFSGALVDLYSEGRAKTNYTPALVVASILLAANLLVSLKIKFYMADKEKLVARNVGKAICSLKIIVYMVTVVVIGLSMGLIWTFLYVVVEVVAIAWNPDFAHMKLLQGLMLGFTYFFGEVPFFFLSSYVIERLGNIPTFAFSMAMLSLRLLLYSYVTNPWFFLPIDLLHGVSFGLLYPNIISYGSSVAPKGAQATVQGIVKSLFVVGVSTGGIVGGLLYDVVGGSEMYFYLGLFNAAFTILFVTVQIFIKRTNGKDAQDVKDQGEIAALREGQDTQDGFGPALDDRDAEGARNACDKVYMQCAEDDHNVDSK